MLDKHRVIPALEQGIPLPPFSRKQRKHTQRTSRCAKLVNSAQHLDSILVTCSESTNYVQLIKQRGWEFRTLRTREKLMRSRWPGKWPEESQPAMRIWFIDPHNIIP